MSAPRFRSRELHAAAHVVAEGDRIDWDGTLRFRHVLWEHGLGVAEAMDTAQRGMGLDWPQARELIERTLADARAAGGSVVCGASTDGLAPDATPTLDDIVAAYLQQCEVIEGGGGRVVLMASRHLARVATSPDDYRWVYERVLAEVGRPVIVHWLGPAFDPALEGYWGARDLDGATEVALQVLGDLSDRIAGIKLSLLDAGREVAMRRRLPEGVRMFTGDDFNYVELIRGDEHGHSDALLGILDAIHPAVPAAMAALDAGDARGFEDALAPTVPLGRHVFGAPTRNYKTGLVWLAYLNGHQERFTMLGGLENARSPEHLVTAWRLAADAGVIADPERAARRARDVVGDLAAVA